MAAQTFLHAAKLSPSGHRLLDRLLASLCNAAFEERIHAWRKSGKSISLNDPFGSLTAIRRLDPEWQAIPVPVVRSALVHLDRATRAFLSRVKSGREPGFPRFRARSGCRSFRIDDPKSARCSLRIRDDGRPGELRRKGLPPVGVAWPKRHGRVHVRRACVPSSAETAADCV